jgi:hypothetical protein
MAGRPPGRLHGGADDAGRYSAVGAGMDLAGRAAAGLVACFREEWGRDARQDGAGLRAPRVLARRSASSGRGAAESNALIGFAALVDGWPDGGGTPPPRAAAVQRAVGDPAGPEAAAAWMAGGAAMSPDELAGQGLATGGV